MLKQELWGKSPCGKDILLYTLSNSSGAYVKVSSIGAGIVSIVVPDRNGNLADVTLGYPEPTSYLHDGPCAGKTPGRFAGRIAKARFTLDGVEYILPANDGINHLHGGPDGFQNKIWDSCECNGGVLFRYRSENGEMGYPGTLDVSVHYSWGEDNTLQITLEAESDAPTIVNLTNHAYFNLDGEGNEDIRNHTLKLEASRYIPTDSAFIPTGKTASAAGTPMDFSRAVNIGEGMASSFPDIIYGKGYNTCWILEDVEAGQVRKAATLHSPSSGRRLTVSTTQPGIVIYTGGWLSGSPVGKCGRSYRDHEGIALECQNIPDAPNHPEFPSSVLRPGEKYLHKIHFAFDTKH